MSSALALVLGALAVAVPSVLVTVGPAAAAAPMHGIDVSSWQGPVDWGAVRRSGRLFAFAKATEGQTFVDRTFSQNRLDMALNGLVLRGFYHFARPDRNSAASEAAHYLRTVGPLGPGEVPVLDLEVAPGPGVGDWAAEWLALVAKGTGKTPVLYSYQSYLYSIPTARLTQYPLWVAAWGNNDGTVPKSPPKTDRWSSWTWWQYTSNAVVPGVTGRVDDSIFAGSAADLAALAGTSLPATPADPLGDLLRGLLGGLLGGAPKP
ncbi:MAG TPA: glycoside hydrolase family 25 protein [Acidimicrobiales bacterium]|nr:glycoside hydrolase family 25 protein [Acidimicrobiales bacterium]